MIKIPENIPRWSSTCDCMTQAQKSRGQARDRAWHFVSRFFIQDAIHLLAEHIAPSPWLGTNSNNELLDLSAPLAELGVFVHTWNG